MSEIKKVLKPNNVNLSGFNKLKKAYQEGIYSDSPANRKLGRVGMTYQDYAAKIKGEKEEKKDIILNESDIIKNSSFLSNASDSDLDLLIDKLSLSVDKDLNDENKRISITKEILKNNSFKKDSDYKKIGDSLDKFIDNLNIYSTTKSKLIVNDNVTKNKIESIKNKYKSESDNLSLRDYSENEDGSFDLKFYDSKDLRFVPETENRYTEYDKEYSKRSSGYSSYYGEGYTFVTIEGKINNTNSLIYQIFETQGSDRFANIVSNKLYFKNNNDIKSVI